MHWDVNKYTFSTFTQEMLWLDLVYNIKLESILFQFEENIKQQPETFQMVYKKFFGVHKFLKVNKIVPAYTIKNISVFRAQWEKKIP